MKFLMEARWPGVLTRVNARIARFGMFAAVAGLMAIVAVVAWQVFGRYVLNSSPTWAENLALVLILYVTLIGAAVGVRDAGHIGMDSLLVLAPEKIRNRIELAIHVLVGIFGVFMAWNGWILGESVAAYKLPNIELSEAVRYAPLVISGVMIVLFSFEHLVSALRGVEVEPAWH
jgi:TRAP-type C4-dicarboxylate transport system permease small subunit